MGAGKYPDTFTWLHHFTYKNILNEDVDMYEVGETLFGRLDPLTGTEAEAFGGVQGQTSATITLRQYPRITTLDHIIHKKFNERYVITGVRKGNNETILDVNSYNQLDLGHIVPPPLRMSGEASVDWEKNV